MKEYSVAILGVGSRGAFTYGSLLNSLKGKFKIVSLCDIKKEAIDLVKDKFGVSDDNCFLSEDEFFKEKRADVIVIATQDRDHVREAIKALKLGYDILLEKPISPVKEELEELLEVYNQANRKVLVCHVLRYAPAYLKIKELLNNNEIGRLVKIESLERVAYWHQAHSFVRGNWRRDDETSPMIMQKCCHDLDIIQWFIGSKCKQVYSTGELAFFNRDNKPKDAASRCQDCKYIKSCAYSAELQYPVRFKEQHNKQGWPFNVLVFDKMPFTQKDVRNAYQNGQYGRCVFECDNNVVDHQQVEMVFENGVRASHTMTAFTAQFRRRMDLHGTLGEIVFDEEDNSITLYKYNGLSSNDKTVWKIDKLITRKDDKGFSHGGGDNMIVQNLYSILQGDILPETSLEASVESHLIALAAEESRKNNKIVKVH